MTSDNPNVVIPKGGIKTTVTTGLDLRVTKVDAKSLVKTYTGEPITLTKADMQKVSVIYKKSPLVYGTDFDIVGYVNNNKKGSMTVIIEGRGKYSGTKTFKVKIEPKKIDN